MSLIQAHLVLLLSEYYLDLLEESGKNIEIGFPALPEAENRLLFALLRKWLQWCDENHRCINDEKTQKKLHTRLISVGNPDDLNYQPDKVSLVETRQENISGEYIALSNCWGKLTPEQKEACYKTPKNYESRRQSFHVDSLLLNLQDAIKVTQELRNPYLWIDSCCTFQNDSQDWKNESKCMENVFASAYCTIAAASAERSDQGFLHSKNNTNEDIYIQDGPAGKIFVCAEVACFDEEIEKASLNSRAWVMQERFLSCRTIHFGHRHTYLQCGVGILSEDLTFLFR